MELLISLVIMIGTLIQVIYCITPENHIEKLSLQLELLIKEKNSFDAHVSNLNICLMGRDESSVNNFLLRHLHRNLGDTNTFRVFHNEVQEFDEKQSKHSLYIIFQGNTSLVSFFHQKIISRYQSILKLCRQRSKT